MSRGEVTLLRKERIRRSWRERGRISWYLRKRGEREDGDELGDLILLDMESDLAYLL